MKIKHPILYYPAIIDFQADYAFFPTLYKIDMLGEKERIGVKFYDGTATYKIIKLLSQKLTHTIVKDMWVNHHPEPDGEPNLRNTPPLSKNQRMTLIALPIKRAWQKLLGKPVRKTVSIPTRLNAYAEKHNINFSRLLSLSIEKEINKDSKKEDK